MRFNFYHVILQYSRNVDYNLTILDNKNDTHSYNFVHRAAYIAICYRTQYIRDFLHHNFYPVVPVQGYIRRANVIAWR